MENELQVRIENEIRKIMDRASNVDIYTDIPFNDVQLTLLKELNYLSVNQTMYDEEAQRDPRTIFYKTNNNLKKALVSLCLTQALVNKRSKGFYTKEYFEANINVTTIEEGNAKKIEFGKCEEKEILAAINEEMVFDYVLYTQGRGIEAFSMEKTNCRGLPNFTPGGNQTYEFARFEKLYHEEKTKRLTEEKEKLQLAFKETFLRELAVGMAQQQLEKNENIGQLVNAIFEKESYLEAIDQILNNSLSNQIADEKQQKLQQNQSIKNNLIEYRDNDYTKEFIAYIEHKKNGRSR